MLRTEALTKSFGGLKVLEGISFDVPAGERRGLIGPNGAGKTTLLNILSGIDVPTSGDVYFGGRLVTPMSAHRRAQMGVGRTFQIGNLFNENTVEANIILALLARDRLSLRMLRPLASHKMLKKEAVSLLETWGLTDHKDTLVGSLSYGQRRVIEIVLALASQPKLLLLDEPAAGLSNQETTVIMETIRALDPSLTILLVEHDMDLVFSVCDKVTVLADGHVLAEGTGDEVRRDPNVVTAYLGVPL